jgi:hypothetical protein
MSPFVLFGIAMPQKDFYCQAKTPQGFRIPSILPISTGMSATTELEDNQTVITLPAEHDLNRRADMEDHTDCQGQPRLNPYLGLRPPEPSLTAYMTGLMMLHRR